MVRTVVILTLAQAFAQSGPPIVVLLGGIVGARLAPSIDLATLPVAFMIVGTAAATVPAALLMGRFGRKSGFVGAAAMAAGAGLLAAWAIEADAFWWFCVATALIGANNAFVQQYRFAAAEVLPAHRVGQGLSVLMLAGVAAAWMGPEVASWLHAVDGRAEFAGSFVGLAGLMAVAMLVLLAYENRAPTSLEGGGDSRALRSIAAQPLFLLATGAAVAGYAIMSLIMTATPVSMHEIDRFDLQDTSWVIQSHIMAMYLPSLFSGSLMSRFGAHRVVIVGMLLMLACLGVAAMDRHLMHYWVSLVLLGVGWNFLFVGGTTLLTRTYREAERFKVQALNDFLVFSLQAVAALGSGAILLNLGWEWLLVLSLPVLLALVPLYVAAHRAQGGAAVG